MSTVFEPGMFLSGSVLGKTEVSRTSSVGVADMPTPSIFHGEAIVWVAVEAIAHQTVFKSTVNFGTSAEYGVNFVELASNPVRLEDRGVRVCYPYNQNSKNEGCYHKLYGTKPALVESQTVKDAHAYLLVYFG